MIQVFWHDKGVYTGKKITDVFMDESIPIQVIVKFWRQAVCVYPVGQTSPPFSMERVITLKMNVRIEWSLTNYWFIHPYQKFLLLNT